MNANSSSRIVFLFISTKLDHHVTHFDKFLQFMSIIL